MLNMLPSGYFFSFFKTVFVIYFIDFYLNLQHNDEQAIVNFYCCILQDGFELALDIVEQWPRSVDTLQIMPKSMPIKISLSVSP